MPEILTEAANKIPLQLTLFSHKVNRPSGKRISNSLPIYPSQQAWGGGAPLSVDRVSREVGSGHDLPQVEIACRKTRTQILKDTHTHPMLEYSAYTPGRHFYQAKINTVK